MENESDLNPSIPHAFGIDCVRIVNKSQSSEAIRQRDIDSHQTITVYNHFDWMISDYSEHSAQTIKWLLWDYSGAFQVLNA